MTDTPCPTCDTQHSAEACPALRTAEILGAQPPGVPVKVYGAYQEARAALKLGASPLAVSELRWLLGALAEAQGAAKDADLAQKLEHLSRTEALSASALSNLGPRALNDGPAEQQAWALMSLAELAITRLFLR